MNDSCLDSAEFKHGIDQAVDVLLYRADPAKRSHLVISDWTMHAHFHELHIATDGIHRSAQLVTEAGEEL